MIRKAHKDDVKRITEIYNEVVANSAATFDLEEKSLEDRAAWMEEHKGNHPLLVYVADGTVVGYASLSSYRERKAFDATVKTSTQWSLSLREATKPARSFMKALGSTSVAQSGRPVISLESTWI